jgi:hypothetical protein
MSSIEIELKSIDTDKSNKSNKLDPHLIELFHFFLLDLKYARKDKSAASRLISNIETAILPSTYLSSTYFTIEQQKYLLNLPILNHCSNNSSNSSSSSSGDDTYLTLEKAFTNRFLNHINTKNTKMRKPPCGPHEFAPWYVHQLQLSEPTAEIKRNYKIWTRTRTK